MKTRKSIYKDCQKCDEPPNCGVAPERCNIFVEEEVIEVGDTVRGKSGGEDCVVFWRDSQQCLIASTVRENAKPFDFPLNRLTLISKGPRIHTFEGEINDIHFKDGDPYNGGAQHFQSGPFKRLTLTEEEK